MSTDRKRAVIYIRYEANLDAHTTAADIAMKVADWIKYGFMVGDPRDPIVQITSVSVQTPQDREHQPTQQSCITCGFGGICEC